MAYCSKKIVLGKKKKFALAWTGVLYSFLLIFHACREGQIALSNIRMDLLPVKFGPESSRAPVRNLNQSLGQVHKCTRVTQLELSFNFMKTLMCCIWDILPSINFWSPCLCSSRASKPHVVKISLDTCNVTGLPACNKVKAQPTSCSSW